MRETHRTTKSKTSKEKEESSDIRCSDSIFSFFETLEIEGRGPADMAAEPAETSFLPERAYTAALLTAERRVRDSERAKIESCWFSLSLRLSAILRCRDVKVGASCSKQTFTRERVENIPNSLYQSDTWHHGNFWEFRRDMVGIKGSAEVRE
ncbi:hypothetical protein L1049_002685 [Liquidambar formosana]|uniref:Uncharacterized protein n=1 Tax=Liquidambar formosana TaxID=63359 RepID=A0AAP0NKM9_LIQFO